jgi:hypothetical protein
MFPTCPIDRRRPIRRVASTLLLIVITISRHAPISEPVSRVFDYSESYHQPQYTQNFLSLVVKHVPKFLVEVNVQMGRVDIRFNLLQLEQQLLFVRVSKWYVLCTDERVFRFLILAIRILN